MNDPFTAKTIPAFEFGAGVFDRLVDHIVRLGTSVLVLTDASHEKGQARLQKLLSDLSARDVSFHHEEIALQERPQDDEFQIGMTAALSFDCLVSIGGGRLIDGAKSLAGNKPHIAVTTSIGTGAAMNNLVFGPSGKEVLAPPRVVIADPDLMTDLDRGEFASRALGVWALLSEAYIAPASSIYADALIWSGLEAFSQGFLPGLEGAQQGRERLLYASLMSGIGCGQSGYGLVHRFAYRLEQMTSLTYGEAAASLLAELTHLQIEALSDRFPDHPAMDKYAMLGELLASRPFEDREEAYASLVGTLRRWAARLEIPRIPLDEADVEKLVQDVLDNWDDGALAIPLLAEELEIAILRRLV